MDRRKFIGTGAATDVVHAAAPYVLQVMIVSVDIGLHSMFDQQRLDQRHHLGCVAMTAAARMYCVMSNHQFPRCRRRAQLFVEPA